MFVVRKNWLWFAALAISLSCANPQVAVAKDLEALGEFVEPIYTAMFLTVMCMRGNSRFLAETSGQRGTALHYAEHVKDEAIAGLTHDEAVAVLKIAGDAARQTARKKLYELAVPEDGVATVRAVGGWCSSEGKQFVLKTIEQHEAGHGAVAELLARAKQ